MNAITKFKALSFMFLTAGAFTFLNAGITATLHNLSPTGVADGTNDSNIKAAAGELNEEICSYCHTPHGASSSFSGAPLWNKGTMSAGGFTLYGTTIAGTTVDGDANGINAQSMACLSCHDGVSGINSIVNAPGSGGYAGDAGALVTFMTAGTAKTMPAGITQIGRDLSNDHPVSITYTPGAASLVATNTALTGWVGATTVADLLRGAGSDKVECGSCHDPHTSDNLTFLRKTNTGSALCLGCHAK